MLFERHEIYDIGFEIWIKQIFMFDILFCFDYQIVDEILKIREYDWGCLLYSLEDDHTFAQGPH
jgi:hypothetical protein